MIGFVEDLIGADRKDTFGECDTSDDSRRACAGTGACLGDLTGTDR